ncbi:MAG: hypothetical protein U0L20_07325 [Ruminococcus sp.]|nr:hypothetical protein [Ruminococcus sp.]
MSKRFIPKFSQHKPIEYGNKIIDVKRVSNSKFDIVTDVANSRRSKAIRLVEKLLTDIELRLLKDFNFPKIAVINFDKHNFGVDAIGGYDRNTGVLFLNSKYDTVEKIIRFVTEQNGMFANSTVYAPIMHELGHKYYYDYIKLLAKKRNIDYNKAKEVVDNLIYEYIHLRNENGRFLSNNLSFYANVGYAKRKYTEIIAEAFSALDESQISQELIDLLR